MRENTSQTELSKTAIEILSYLSEHPDAQDTLDGILQWWLLDQAIKTRVRSLRHVITELVAEGFILQQSAADSRMIYRVNPAKSDEIRAFVIRHSE